MNEMEKGHEYIITYIYIYVCMCIYEGMLNILYIYIYLQKGWVGTCKNHQKKDLNVMWCKL